MNNSTQEFLKRDIIFILQLNAQINYSSRRKVAQAHNMIIQKKPFKTTLGQKYSNRLEQILTGANISRQCVFCGNDLDNDTLVCNDCLDKYKLSPSAKTDTYETDMDITASQGSDYGNSEDNSDNLKSSAPWLFLRVLALFIAVFVLLYSFIVNFHSLAAIPSLMFLGASALPLSILLFAFEINIPRDISIFEVIKMLFFGGAVALLLILCLFEIFPIGQLDYFESVTVSLIEELCKLMAIIIFIRRINPKHILNGILIGAAVGAGFSIVETSGYAFRFYLLSGNDLNCLIDIILLRFWSSFGSNTVWSAIAGGGLIAAAGDKAFNFKLFCNMSFLKFLAVPVILHAIWDCPFMDSGNSVYIKLIILTVTAWLVLSQLIKKVNSSEINKGKFLRN